MPKAWLNLELPMRVQRFIFDVVQLFKDGAAQRGLDSVDMIPIYCFTS